MLDQSNTGVITAANLYEEMRRIDNEITYEEVEDVLKKVDKDGSGTIDFDELYHYFAQIGDDSGGGKCCKRLTSLTQLCQSNRMCKLAKSVDSDHSPMKAVTDHGQQ